MPRLSAKIWLELPRRWGTLDWETSGVNVAEIRA